VKGWFQSSDFREFLLVKCLAQSATLNPLRLSVRPLYLGVRLGYQEALDLK